MNCVWGGEPYTYNIIRAHLRNYFACISEGSALYAKACSCILMTVCFQHLISHLITSSLCMYAYMFNGVYAITILGVSLMGVHVTALGVLCCFALLFV